MTSAHSDWHHQSGEEVLARLDAVVTGLPTQEASRRLADDGPNVLTSAERIAAWRIVVAQFDSVLVWLLIAAGVVSCVIASPPERTGY